MIRTLRDPEGYVTNDLRRVMSEDYLPHYKRLMSSGLYKTLTSQRLLIRHTEIDERTLRPEKIPFVTYPQEWTFEQVRDAALLTLRVIAESLKYNMILKDASADNVQFKDCKPVFIDTSSFVIHEKGKPWQAYRQFCEEFLAPLLLMSRTNLGWQRVPLDSAVKLLPKWRVFSDLGLHLYWHSKAPQKKKLTKSTNVNVGLIVESLRRAVKSIPKPRGSTIWDGYSELTSYTVKAAEEKSKAITEALSIVQPAKVLDLGCNKGLYSSLVAEDSYIVAIDSDPRTVGEFYKAQPTNCSLVIADLCNPTPSKGWMNSERPGLLERLYDYDADLTTTLALLHHLCLGNSIPLESIAYFLSTLSPWLLIEFVPENDKQVAEILSTLDAHHPYNFDTFVESFSRYYKVKHTWLLTESTRTIHLMERRVD